MTKHESGVIIFGNLIEANNSKEATFGRALAMPVATPFQAKNAAGSIPKMDISTVSARAKLFGERFKAGMTAAKK